MQETDIISTELERVTHGLAWSTAHAVEDRIREDMQKSAPWLYSVVTRLTKDGVGALRGRIARLLCHIAGFEVRRYESIQGISTVFATLLRGKIISKHEVRWTLDERTSIFRMSVVDNL